jgi:hypothetical protein
MLQNTVINQTFHLLKFECELWGKRSLNQFALGSVYFSLSVACYGWSQTSLCECAPSPSFRRVGRRVSYQQFDSQSSRSEHQWSVWLVAVERTERRQERVHNLSVSSTAVFYLLCRVVLSFLPKLTWILLANISGIPYFINRSIGEFFSKYVSIIFRTSRSAPDRRKLFDPLNKSIVLFLWFTGLSSTALIHCT